MINLLPENYQANLKSLYRRRLLLLSLFLLFLFFIISLVLLVPSHLIFSVKNKDVANRLTVAESRERAAGFKEILEVAKDTNKKIELLEISKKETIVSGARILAAIVGHAGGNVSLENISLNAGKISLRGTAQNRDLMLKFLRALESDPLFADVESPISNLIADENLRFTVSLSIAQITKNAN